MTETAIPLTHSEATDLTARIRNWIEAYPIEDVKRAFLGRIWLAMEYDSWAAWCDAELGGFRLPAVERRELVDQLADLGMSNRAIAEVVRADRRTVDRDVSRGELAPRGRKVIGQDGKSYPAQPSAEKRREEEQRRVLVDRFTSVANAIGTLEVWGRYADFAPLWTDYEPSLLHPPQLSRHLEKDNLENALKLINFLIDWRKSA